jgi:hypothetical protein
MRLHRFRGFSIALWNAIERARFGKPVHSTAESFRQSQITRARFTFLA